MRGSNIGPSGVLRNADHSGAIPVSVFQPPFVFQPSVSGRVRALAPLLVLSLTLGLVSLPVPGMAHPIQASLQEQTLDATPVLAQVVLETSVGDIVMALDSKAPITSANFLRYVDEGRLDGTDFYRSMVISPGTGLVQGGTANQPDRVLAPIAHEATDVSGLTHRDGAVSMARNEPGSATGDFFIIVGDVSSLDANRMSAGDPGFAVFGHITQGMEIVRVILASPTSPTQGEGFLRGQMLDPPIRILSVRRAATSPSPLAD